MNVIYKWLCWPCMKGILVMSSLGVLTSCTSTQVTDYKNEKPELVLENYLHGDLEAHGFFQGRSGLIAKRFKVSMKGTWVNNVGTLHENFEYSDGTKSTRVWTIEKSADGKYSGTAADVIGRAEGESSGNAFRWRYVLKLPVGDKTYNVHFDDWMYLMDRQIMLNKSKMSKFGIYLGEVTLVFIKKKS